MDQCLFEAINRTIVALSVRKVRLRGAPDALATRLASTSEGRIAAHAIEHAACGSPPGDLERFIALHAIFHRDVAAVVAGAPADRRRCAETEAVLGSAFQRATEEFAQALDAVRRSLTAC